MQAGTVLEGRSERPFFMEQIGILHINGERKEKTMSILYMMVGVPGAGKTTYAKKKLSYMHYIGTDQIRKELWGTEKRVFRGYSLVHGIMERRLIKKLISGRDVVLDCSNTTRRKRKKILDVLPEDIGVIAIYLDTNLETILQNNRNRSRHVPPIGIIFMYLSRQKPLKEEGFLKVVTIRKASIRKAAFC